MGTWSGTVYSGHLSRDGCVNSVFPCVYVFTVSLLSAISSHPEMSGNGWILCLALTRWKEQIRQQTATLPCSSPSSRQPLRICCARSIYLCTRYETQKRWPLLWYVKRSIYTTRAHVIVSKQRNWTLCVWSHLWVAQRMTKSTHHLQHDRFDCLLVLEWIREVPQFSCTVSDILPWWYRRHL